MSIFPEESNLTPIILWWISRFLWSGRQTLATNSLDWQMWRKWFVTCRAWLGLWEEEHTWHSSMVCGTCRRVGERVFALLYNSKQFSVESQQHLKFKISVLNQHAMYILWRFSRWPSKNDQKLSMKSYTVNMFDGMRGLFFWSIVSWIVGDVWAIGWNHGQFHSFIAGWPGSCEFSITRSEYV